MSKTSTIQLPPSSKLESLPPSRYYDLTSPADERQKTLQELLVAHHGAAAPLREPHMILHNHMPHILCSALDLGQSTELLKETYNDVMDDLIKIDHTFPRGEKIDGSRLREYFGKREYTVAFVDFFDEEFRKENGDWKKVVARYLFEGDSPLMNGLVGGLGHPLIHLGYAFDFESKEVASEGFSLLCTDYSDFSFLLDHPQPDTSTYKTTSLAEVLERVNADSRFDNLSEYPGIVEMGKVMQKGGSAIIEHWNAFQVTDPLQQLQQLCDLAVLMALTSYDEHKEVDFFLLHVMTSVHGIRSLWPHIPSHKQADMLKGFAILVISTHVCQKRIPIREDYIDDVDVKGRDWAWVAQTAISHPAKFDVHFFKAVRAPMAFAETFGEKDGFYLKAALRFLDDFSGWTGFGQGIPDFDERGEGWYPDSRL